jgi:CitMHS family citrate-Mg2+:H+ or citrate-Ca2+:H+ symporter
VLAALGFATIATFLLAVISKRLSVITALVLIPVIFGFLAGISLKDLSEMMLNGIKQVAPTGILLFFAVLYFSVMLDAGLFDPIISFIVRKVKGDPLKVVLGTAILTM